MSHVRDQNELLKWRAVPKVGLGRHGSRCSDLTWLSGNAGSDWLSEEKLKYQRTGHTNMVYSG